MKNKTNLFLIIAVFFAFIVGCKGVDSNKQTTGASGASKTETMTSAKNETSGITAANFAKIKTGMKYDEVVKILGAEGELLSESEIAGFKTQIYQWKAGMMSNMNATFQNGKLMGKSQIGLE